MTAQEYLTTTLKKLADPAPLEALGGTSLEDTIFAKVMSKKFRKTKADEATVSAVKSAIRHAIEHREPVTFSLLFGGNKLWRFEEAPEIDWAELFALVYYLRWMKSVAGVYEHGALLDFYSQDISIESLNNVPRAETDQYQKTFQAMLEWIKPYLPERVQVRYRRHADEYSDLRDYATDIEAAKKLVLADNNGQLPQLDEAQKTATELNVRLRPGQADDPQWREKVELEHQAIFRTKTLLPYLTDTTLIPISPTPFPGLVAVGSTKRSMAKFWAGVGALERSDDGFNALVLTPKQLQDARFTWEDVHLDGLQGKNFSRIRVL